MNISAGLAPGLRSGVYEVLPALGEGGRSVNPGPRFAPGKPTPAVDKAVAPSTNAGRHFDVSLDGKRFLLLKDVESGDSGRKGAPEIRIVLHFLDQLNRTVGTGAAR